LRGKQFARHGRQARFTLVADGDVSQLEADAAAPFESWFVRLQPFGDAAADGSTSEQTDAHCALHFPVPFATGKRDK
jgi:hypothetical protein